MPDDLQDLLGKEMDRKQFLLIIGTGFASLFGISRIIKLLSSNHNQTSNSLGYSSGDYGGKSN